jgi:hypothetical protein
MTEEELIEYKRIIKKANIVYICMLIALLVLGIVTST